MLIKSFASAAEIFCVHEPKKLMVIQGRDIDKKQSIGMIIESPKIMTKLYLALRNSKMRASFVKAKHIKVAQTQL